MNIPLPVFLLLMAALAAMSWRSPRYAFAVWPVTVLALPWMRTMVGPAPLYLYDAVAVILLIRLYTGAELRRWPQGIPRWHWWFLGVGMVFGTLVPMMRFGFAPEMLWILGHAGLAWMAYPAGIALYTTRAGSDYRVMLAHGALVGIAYGAVVGALQFGDPVMAAKINDFHFQDMAAHLVRLEEVGGLLSSSRVNGPHGDPNTFGGTTALAGVICLLLYGAERRKLALLALGMAAFTVAMTVSRQVLVATVLAVIVVGMLSRPSRQLQLLGAVAVLMVAALASGALANWGERLSRWEGGVGQDMNVVGRLVIGPMRLFGLIEEEPSVLLTGVGLDVQKLVKKAEDKRQQVGILQSGFVSNSFLLALYYLGAAGFVLTLSFWSWTGLKAWGRRRSTRPLDMGAVALAVLLIASDNYAFIVETTVTMLFLLAAILTGRWWTSRPVLQARPALQTRSPRFAGRLSQ